MLKILNVHIMMFLVISLAAIVVFSAGQLEYDGNEVFRTKIGVEAVAGILVLPPFRHDADLKISVTGNKLMLSQGEDLSLYRKKGGFSHEKDSIMLFNEPHYITYPGLKIFHEEQEILYSSGSTYDDFFIYRDKLYVLDSRYSRKGKVQQYFRVVEFAKKYRLKGGTLVPFLLLVTLALLLLLIRHLFSLPANVMKNRDYLIRYRIFKLLDFNRIVGSRKRSLFCFSAAGKREREMVVRSGQGKLVENFKRLFVDIFIYELSSWGRDDIIAQISGYMNRKIAELEKILTGVSEGEGRDPGDTAALEAYYGAIDEIKKQTEIIAGISKIQSPGFEKTDMGRMLTEIKTGYLAQQVELILPPQPLSAVVDRTLLKTAAKNLIDNAVEYTCSSGKGDIVSVTLQDIGQGQLQVIIKNPVADDLNFREIGSLGYTTKATGTGIGILLAKRILLRHDTDLICYLKDGCFVAEFSLSLVS